MTSNRPVQAGNIVAASMRAWAQKAQRVVWPALALALAIGWPASGGAFQLLPDDPSPKSGTAQVAAQGVIDVGGGDLRWQVTSRTASPPANAAPQMSQPGFLIVDEGVMLVEDLSSGAQHRLPAGEAVLTTPGSEQLRVALGSDAAAYLDIALVDAATLPEDASGLLFTSEGFPGLGARHDMDLLADTLPAGVPMTVPGGALPTLVLVRAGSADVTTDAGDIISLADDEAVALSGAVVVTGTGEGAEVVAVVTGPAVPRLSAPSGATPAAPARAIEAPSGDATAAPQVAVAATPEAETEAAAADRDSDGLTDAEEAELNTDPALADTDEDGLLDGDEVRLGTAALAPDSDSDGVLDGDEVAQGSDPLDGGVVAPAEEAPVEDAAPEAGAPVAGDSDGDGLEDSIEFELGTDPADTDTDDDGASDGDEYYVHQTGTRNPDSDGDAVLDGDEVANGTNPNDPNSF